MLRTGNWEWYYPDNSDTGESIASIAGYSAASVSSIQRHANVLKREAAAILEMTHHRAGEEHASIGVIHMGQAELGHPAKLDSVVYLVAPDEGKGGKSNAWRAVQSIEFGHYVHNYNTRRNRKLGAHEGPIKRRSGGSTWVKPVAPLQKATKKMVAMRRLSIK